MTTVRKDDLDVLVVACARYLPDDPEDMDPGIRMALSRLDDARQPGREAAAPDPLPPGRWGRIEIPGYRENEGWISEETRFGLQVAVVRDRDGTETAAVGMGPLCRVVWLPVPDPRPEPRLALPAGGSPWADGDDDLDDDDGASWEHDD